MNALTLHALHQSAGATFGELRGRELVRSYAADSPAGAVAAPEAEYRAAREGIALFDNSARDVIAVTGEDRLSFLHGMVTNDVKGLAEGQTCYAAMLTPKGALVSDARILRRKGDVLIDVEPGMGATVLDFLNKYLISEDAELRSAPELAILSVLGPGAEALKPEAAALGEVLPPWLHALPGFDLLVARDRLGEAFGKLVDAGASPIGFDACEVLRVESGQPRYGADMDETTLVLEAGLERAIHYNKGCYIGQEVVARATFRGHVNRKLSGLLLGELQPEPKTELYAGEKKVGWVTTVVRSRRHGQVVALGYVHRNHLEPGAELRLSSGGNARVQPLPW